MKRLWSTPEFLLRQKRRGRKLHRRRHHASDTRPRRPQLRKEELHLKAPEDFRLFDEPNVVLEYCNSLRRHLAKPGAQVFLDLREVRHFSNDGLLLLRSITDRSTRARQTRVSGNLPHDVDVATEFKASGFFAGFTKPPADLPPAKGLMLKKSHNKVHADVAAELVDFARKNAAMDKKSANICSQTLVEIMTNTHNHAGNKMILRSSNKRVPHTWFASVYCRNQIAYFNFIDLGIGIFKSRPARNLLKHAGVSISSYGRIRLLKDAFEGRIGSATGEKGRGLGLPRMKRDGSTGKLSDLEIFTSDIAGSIADLNFRSVRHSLRGTAFRWCTNHDGGETQ